MIPPRLLPALYGLSLAACASAVPIIEQQVLGNVAAQVDKTEPSGQLSGRFLHITGISVNSASSRKPRLTTPRFAFRYPLQIRNGRANMSSG
jgi:hypothetical protein